MKKIALFTLCFAALACGNIQERPEPELMFRLQDFPELQHTHNVQGCAILGDLLFSMQDKGWCNVFDLGSRTPVSQFPLASYGRNQHANVAFFGPYRYDSTDRFPLLYVSQCKSKPVTEIGLAETDSLSRLLFVERILADESGTPFGSELVQIVAYEPKQWNSRLWIADTKHPDAIWCYGNTVGNEKPGNHIVLSKFAFPEFSADKFLVTLSDEDALETFNYDDILPEGARGPQDGILQGAFLRDGLLFLPIGVGTPEHPHELFVSDVSRFGSKRLRWAHFDYTDIIPWEPEDYDIWNDRLVFPCNTDSAGVVYSLPYRKLVRSLTVTQPDSRP